MTLLNRMLRLVHADVHGLLDHVEEPGALLRQAIREMEESLNQDRQSLEQLTQRQQQAEGRAQRLTASLAAADAELDLCLKAGQDELARALIRRKLLTQRQAETVDRDREARATQIATLHARLEQRQIRLAEIIQEAELLAPSDEQPLTIDESRPEAGVSAQDIEIALLREKHLRGQS